MSTDDLTRYYRALQKLFRLKGASLRKSPRKDAGLNEEPFVLRWSDENLFRGTLKRMERIAHDWFQSAFKEIADEHKADEEDAA